MCTSRGGFKNPAVDLIAPAARGRADRERSPPRAARAGSGPGGGREGAGFGRLVVSPGGKAAARERRGTRRRPEAGSKVVTRAARPGCPPALKPVSHTAAPARRNRRARLTRLAASVRAPRARARPAAPAAALGPPARGRAAGPGPGGERRAGRAEGGAGRAGADLGALPAARWLWGRGGSSAGSRRRTGLRAAARAACGRTRGPTRRPRARRVPLPPGRARAMAASPGSGSANPRKFSEKIALHTQRQAEETRAFEQLMTDLTLSRVSGRGRGARGRGWPQRRARAGGAEAVAAAAAGPGRAGAARGSGRRDRAGAAAASALPRPSAPGAARGGGRVAGPGARGEGRGRAGRGGRRREGGLRGRANGAPGGNHKQLGGGRCGFSWLRTSSASRPFWTAGRGGPRGLGGALCTVSPGPARAEGGSGAPGSHCLPSGAFLSPRRCLLGPLYCAQPGDLTRTGKVHGVAGDGGGSRSMSKARAGTNTRRLGNC